MRVLVAPTAFKGCLSALQAAEAMASGVKAAGGRADIMPISDGGDSFVETLHSALGGRYVSVRVRGPLNEPRAARFLAAKDIAVIEMARASGLALVPKGKLDALGATSFGTGQLIKAALDRGCRRIFIGLGGSATNDGGAGCAQALGARLLDAKGRELGLGAGALRGLNRIDTSKLDPRLAGAALVALTDVRNPVLGPKGSARVYGPQKGADPSQVRAIEAGLRRWVRVLRRDTGIDADVPGAGAAGALASGLLAVLGARLEAGSPYVLDLLGARKRLRACDLVLTGEGSFDRQSLYGKAPAELSRLAKSLRKPVHLIAGQVDMALKPEMRKLGIKTFMRLTEARTPEEAMRRSRALLRSYARLIVEQP